MTEPNWKRKRRYQQMQPVEVARAERDRVLTAVRTGHPTALEQALALLIAHRDESGPEGLFSANDLRDAFDRAGIPTSVRGAAFQTARTRHLIEGRGWETSTDKGTHAKRIELYGDPFADARRGPVTGNPARGAVATPPPPTPAPPQAAAEEITVPVHRTTTGKFAGRNAPLAGQGDLLAEVTR